MIAVDLFSSSLRDLSVIFAVAPMVLLVSSLDLSSRPVGTMYGRTTLLKLLDSLLIATWMS